MYLLEHVGSNHMFYCLSLPCGGGSDKLGCKHNMSPKSNFRRGKASTQASRVRNGPKQFKSNVELRHTYRYVSTNATSTALTPTSLLCSAGTMCTVANTTSVSFYGSVKINQIEMWCPPASQGSSATCSVDWVGFGSSPSREFSDTTVSVATPAYVRCSPPPMSLASFWQTAGSGTLCSIVAPVGTIIDVSLALILQDEDAAAAFSAITAGIAGQVYYLSLDSNVTHRYTPVSLTTTT
jgi:hypothetical protein